MTFKQSALGGILLVTGSNLLIKILGLISQILIASYLQRDDFAIFAFATAIAAFAIGFRNGGSDNIIIQRAKYSKHFANLFFSYSLLFNLALLIFFELIALYFFVQVKSFEISWVLILIALGILAGTLQPILNAKLSLHCRFSDLANINLISLGIKHLSSILMAFLGFGVYSFVMPLILQYAAASLLSYRLEPQLPKITRFSKRKFLYIFQSSKWIIAGNIGFQLTNNSQLIIASLFASTFPLGLFFFCIMIINSPIALINSAVSGVIFPKLSLIQENKEKYKEAIMKAIRIGYSLNILVSIVSSIALPWLVNFLWRDKWHDAIPLLIILSYSIHSTTLLELNSYVMASNGIWKKRFCLLISLAVIELAGLFISFQYLNLFQTCVVLIYLKMLFSLFSTYFVFKEFGMLDKMKEFLFAYFLPAASISSIVSLSMVIGSTTNLKIFVYMASLFFLAYFTYLIRQFIYSTLGLLKK